MKKIQKSTEYKRNTNVSIVKSWKGILIVISIRIIERRIGTKQLDFLGNCQCRLSFLDNMHKEARGLKHSYKGDIINIFVK